MGFVNATADRGINKGYVATPFSLQGPDGLREGGPRESSPPPPALRYHCQYPSQVSLRLWYLRLSSIL